MMSWIFGGGKPPPEATAGFPQIPVPPPGGGGNDGDDKKKSKMEYSFDSTALEKAARAAKELETSSEFLNPFLDSNILFG